MFIADLTRELGINPGKHLTEMLKMEDKSRVKNAQNQQLESSKRRRTLLRSKRKKYFDKLKEQEKESYGAGCF